jgi:hypothetical protein
MIKIKVICPVCRRKRMFDVECGCKAEVGTFIVTTKCPTCGLVKIKAQDIVKNIDSGK